MPAQQLPNGFPTSRRGSSSLPAESDFQKLRRRFPANDPRYPRFTGTTLVEPKLPFSWKIPAAAALEAASLIGDFVLVYELGRLAGALAVAASKMRPPGVIPDDWGKKGTASGSPDWDPAKWASSYGSYTGYDMSGISEWWRTGGGGAPQPVIDLTADAEPSLTAWFGDNAPLMQPITDIGSAVPIDDAETFMRYEHAVEQIPRHHAVGLSVETHWWIGPGSPEAPAGQVARWVLPDLAPEPQTAPRREADTSRPRLPGEVIWPTDLPLPGGLVPPDVVIDPGTDPTPTPGPVVTPVTPPTPQPPARGQKERKVRVRRNGVVRFIYRAVGGVTEFLDLLQALWYALPPEYRTGYYRLHKRDGSVYFKKRFNASVAQRTADVVRNFDHLDMQKVFQNLLRNEVTDQLVGRFSRAINKAAPGRGIGGVQGFGSGPWDTIQQFFG